MSQKLSAEKFEWEKIHQSFIKSYDENSDKVYIFEVNVTYPKEPHIISILCKRWKNMQNRIATISNYKMIDFDDVTNENETEHNPNWSPFPNHPYKILII